MDVGTTGVFLSEGGSDLTVLLCATVHHQVQLRNWESVCVYIKIAMT